MSIERRSSQEIEAMAIDLNRVKKTGAFRPRYKSFCAYASAIYGISHSYASRLTVGRKSWRTNISDSTRWRIWERDNFTCHYCGKRQFLSVDHKVPVSLGGTDDDSNLLTACSKCNSKKNDKHYEEFFPPVLQSFRMFEIVTGYK